MTSGFSLILALFAGVCVGALFFEGLWRTVSKAMSNARGLRMFVVSFAVRTAFLLTVLWLVSRGDPFRLAACLVGIFVGRAVIFQIHRGGREVAD
jgi:F1F0 ATPase subunit 2